MSIFNYEVAALFSTGLSIPIATSTVRLERFDVLNRYGSLDNMTERTAISTGPFTDDASRIIKILAV
jgi:hypothetical protein